MDYYLNNFKKNAKNYPITESFQFTLYIFYETYTYKDYLSYVFHIEEFTGGAHPNHELFTINYNIKENKFITIKDLKDKDPNILEELSKTSRTMLKENKNSNSLSMLYEGTTPTIENFSNFVFTKKLNSFELSFISTSVVPTIFTNGANEGNRTPITALARPYSNH